MKMVCIIPARGGSKRIPGKNIKAFRGRPIIEYAIATAQRSNLFDEVIVSTDSFNDIGALATKNGARIHERQPDNGDIGTQALATNILKAEQLTRYAYACVLYPCTPLLRPLDLVRGWERLVSTSADYSYAVDSDREDCGAFYWGATQSFLSILPLDPSRCALNDLGDRAIDINTFDDWERAELMFDRLMGGHHG